MYNMNEEKKILILSDLNTHLENQLLKSLEFKPGKVMTINSYQAEISHAYGDVMRSIIIAIYQYDVHEIYIIGSSTYMHTIELPKSIVSNTEKIKTLDYLFRNCKPEFSSDNIVDWLNGENDIDKSLKASVNHISNHPLIPIGIKINGVKIKKNETEVVIEQTT